jgi:hypothetical protein
MAAATPKQEKGAVPENGHSPCSALLPKNKLLKFHAILVCGRWSNDFFVTLRRLIFFHTTTAAL